MRCRIPASAVFVLAGLTVIPSCDNSVKPDEENDGINETIYINSFESDADTSGWWGYGIGGFLNNAPQGGGERSLLISGGCIAPHAVYELNSLKEDSYLILRFWGKLIVGQGGYMSFGVGGESSQSTGISITDNTWTAYHLPDTLFCPANQRPVLDFMCGGFVPGTMSIDLIEVVRIR